MNRISHAAKVFRHRLVERPLWRLHNRHFFRECPDPTFFGKFPWSSGRPADFLQQFFARALPRLPFSPDSRDQLAPLVFESHQDVLDDANHILENVVDLLGSGPRRLPEFGRWHTDFKSGHSWPLAYHAEIEYLALDRPSDVKVPWELSRSHWVTWLGKAFWRSGEPRYAMKFTELIDSWIRENPYGYGIHWSNAMEVAIRAANWMLGIGFFADAEEVAPDFWVRLLRSLYLHGQFIRFNLEIGRSVSNHYLSDAFGLVAMGVLFFDTRAGRSWFRLGRRILEQQIQIQVYPDGVDFETSVGYHRMVLELFYTAHVLAQGVDRGFSPAYCKRMEAMFEYVLYYLKPDGTAPCIGDADNGRLFRFRAQEDFNDHRSTLGVGAAIYGREDFAAGAQGHFEDAAWLLGAEALQRMPSRVEAPALASRAFPAAGYYILRDKDAYMFADAGKIAAHARWGHGHNDLFSFEMAIGDVTFFADSGTYAYTGAAAEHQRFASTAAHNCLRIDGREIAEMPGLWQIQDRSRPRVLEWKSDRERDLLVAEHFGYTRLDSPVIHRRSFQFTKKSRSWQITDELAGEGFHQVELFFHLGPKVRALSCPDGAVILTLHGTSLELVCDWPLTEEAGELSPSYGVKLPATVLRASSRVRLPVRIQTSWSVVLGPDAVGRIAISTEPGHE